jgi:4-amino-4-deoxy-L-arabinose transferase-like glycosyltransferase
MPWAPLAAAASVVVWVAWTAFFNQAQFGDNIEQFNWSHSMEWGYAKHPPLPTWLMGAAIVAFGRVPALGYAVPAFCFAATAVLTWDIARRLLGGRAAAAAMLLWTLQFSFSWRAQLYNHNTALVLCVAATAWACLKALDGRPAWWLATGVAAGAAMLSKYQALLPLAGLLLALAWTGRLRERRHAAGVAVAVAVMLVMFAPHAVWVAQHDFTTLRYAATSVDTDAAASPAHALRSVLSFAANQLRMLSMLLLAAALYAGWQRLRAPRAASSARREPQATDRDTGRWLAGLLWAPALVLMATAAVGVMLRNHWGVQMFQFFSLWIAWRWQRKAPIDLRRLAWIAAALHAALLAGYAAQHLDVRVLDAGRRLDTLYPARGLARVVAAEWRAASGCPLRYVAGDAYLDGGGDAVVYDSAAATPWVDAAALARAGHVAVVDAPQHIPAGARRVSAFTLGTVREPRVGKTVYTAVVAPAATCR